DEDTVPGDIELEQVQDTTIIRGDNVVTIKA
ncbi:Like-Sm ribonucleoprotein core, partial [Halorubrum sp. Atlit-26R]